MEEKKLVANECEPTEDVLENCASDMKMLEISEAINEIDSKLTDLEIALNMRGEH